MGLEMRNGSGPYFYRKVREGNRVRSIYLGSGEVAAQLAALLCESTRRSEATGHERDGLLDELEQMCSQVDAVVAAELTRAGYHKPRRWKWRKKRS